MQLPCLISSTVLYAYTQRLKVNMRFRKETPNSKVLDPFGSKMRDDEEGLGWGKVTSDMLRKTSQNLTTRTPHFTHCLSNVHLGTVTFGHDRTDLICWIDKADPSPKRCLEHSPCRFDHVRIKTRPKNAKNVAVTFCHGRAGNWQLHFFVSKLFLLSYI